jgi:DNA-binding NtrC family response regulator
MDTATALKESLPLSSVVSIEEGLQELQQAFEARDVKVASITLQRNGRTYRHIVEENQPGVQRTVEGVFTDIKITVSVTSPMQAAINAELQVATTSAAAAASAWADQTSTPTMLGSSMTMRRLDQAISRVARSKHIVLITG